VTTRPAPVRLPDGFTVRLAAGTRTSDGGRTLFGGSPTRLLHLRAGAAAVLARGDLAVTDARTAALARLLLDRGLVDPVAAPRTLSEREVTVVVPVRDRPRELARLLDALPAGVPVVVVDDGSADPAATAAVAGRAEVVLLRHPVSRGPAAARNTGLRAVRTPLVAFVDSDVVPGPGWLGPLLAQLEDPAVGLVAPRIAALEAGCGGPVARYESARSSLDLGPVAALVTPRSRVSYVPSACLLGRVAAFGDGFDEDMHVGEDVDLVWRTVRAGWLVRYEPASVVAHEHRVSTRDWLARKAFYGTGAAPLALRHGPAVAPVVLSPWTAVVAGALLTQRRWSLPVAASVAAAATWRLSRRLEHSEQPLRAAARLAPYGVVSAVWQCGAAATRHWWPVVLPAAVASSRVRRAVVLLAVADGLVDWRRTRPDLDPVRYLALRRLDDLAYGTGLWCGAVRHRTTSPLRPSLVRSAPG
jgi:mycofactocin system glycosyltransferase